MADILEFVYSEALERKPSKVFMVQRLLGRLEAEAEQFRNAEASVEDTTATTTAAERLAKLEALAADMDARAAEFKANAAALRAEAAKIRDAEAKAEAAPGACRRPSSRLNFSVL